MIDLAAMADRGIRLGWRPGANALSIAELVIGFALSALRKINASNVALRNGQEVRNRMGRLLSGRVVGLHGCGHIGKQVVRLLQPFGCRIVVHDVADQPEFYTAYGVQAVSFATLLAESEVLSIHVPLNSATRGLYNAETLASLQPGCVLINTARGELVDEAALFAALTSGRLEAACSDVLCSEPVFDSPAHCLAELPADAAYRGSAAEARLAMGRVAIEGIFENAVPVKGVPPFTGPEDMTAAVLSVRGRALRDNVDPVMFVEPNMEAACRFLAVSLGCSH